jgi:hypothetical protein
MVDAAQKEIVYEPCIFCGATSSSKEHIFGKWLLGSKNLYNEKLKLSDGSFIPYRQLVIPICPKCNNETLSKIEDGVKKQSANPIEYYLWSLKVYIGILYKETLLVSHKFRGKLPLVSRRSVESDLITAKNLFSVYKNKGSFYPNPPGSVIRVPRHGENRYFDYIDVPAIPILGIALPQEFIFALPFDKGRAASATDITKISPVMTSLRFRFLIADIGYDEYRWEEGFSGMTVDRQVFVMPGSCRTRQVRPFSDKEFKFVLSSVGINGEKVGEAWRIENLA